MWLHTRSQKEFLLLQVFKVGFLMMVLPIATQRIIALIIGEDNDYVRFVFTNTPVICDLLIPE